MFVAEIPNRGSNPTVLLRESYREGGKVKSRTLANLTSLPKDRIAAIRAALRGGKVVSTKAEDASIEILRSRPHGHVAAVLGTIRKLGIDKLFKGGSEKKKRLVVAMIASRIVEPASKLATASELCDETLHSSLGKLLNVERVDEDDLYHAMDWLWGQQETIECALAKKHLQDGTLVLYDVTSTYFEGRKCPLAKYGYNRDDKSGKLQIVIGLLCDPEGRPIALEVFDGNTSDPVTVANQIQKLRERFGLKEVIVVGDRGMLTSARIDTDLKNAQGVSWISCLRAPAIRCLVEEGTLQLSLFDQREIGAITSEDYPGERLIVCKNPLLLEDRRRTRNELLALTEERLGKIVEAVRRKCRPLRGVINITRRVEKALARGKMGKHFELQITDETFHFERKTESIAQEEALDGIYIIRTNVTPSKMTESEVVASYKSLSRVERAFRCMKTVDLKLRPIHHYKAERVKAHAFLCMLAYYVEWHMRQALAPLLFEDHEKNQCQQTSPVAAAKVSCSALEKARKKKTDDGFAVHSFHSLLGDLATIVMNTCKLATEVVEVITRPTPFQKRVSALLGVNLVDSHL